MKVELFSEFYGCYYNTVYHILKEAGNRELTDVEFRELIRKTSDTYGFPETTDLIVEKAIKIGENVDAENDKNAWPFFDRVEDNNSRYANKSRLTNITNIPLSTIEKMWLKSIYSDPRVKLFIDDEMALPDLADVDPLFSWDDFVLFDQYTDGDPFQDNLYIEMFRKVLRGVRKKARLEIKFKKPNHNIIFMENGDYEVLPHRGIGTIYIDPDYLEYSERDDKFRLIGNNPRFGRNMVNLSSIVGCNEVEKINVSEACCHTIDSRNAFQRKVVFELVDENNALERFLLYFSHYEKEAEYSEKEPGYHITIYYDETDEIDLVIRVLSFGPYVKVVEPERLVKVIRERLRQQAKLRQ